MFFVMEKYVHFESVLNTPYINITQMLKKKVFGQNK